MTDVMCSKCNKHYVGKGWFCWSGNKVSVPHCNNGNPDKDRILYNSKTSTSITERELLKGGAET